MNAAIDTGGVLHVAALPFPTHQGTQAVIAAMLATLTAHGRRSELLAYAQQQPQEPLPFAVHRARDLARDRSLRSGPSARKLLADAALAHALAGTLRSRAPALVVAHHVEAALIARAIARAPRLFFAHTDLGAELPEYFGRPAAALCARAGRGLDEYLVRSADAVAAISPALARTLGALPGAPPCVRYVPAPWPIPPAIEREERAQARAELGLRAGARVLLYAGNLDRYQGLPAALAAFAQLSAARPDLHLLVGTASDPAALMRDAARAGIAARIHVRPLAGEAARRALHAAADVVVVPRKTQGGLPIKLLDAMARGLPCAVAQAAGAGLPLASAVDLAAAGDAGALAASLARLLDAAPDARAALGLRARDYVERSHDARSFLSAWDGVCRAARTRAPLPRA